MGITAEERDRVGVVVHLTGPEYQAALMNWSVAVPDTHICSLEALRWFRYVAFVVEGTPKAIAEIARWSFEVGDECNRVAFFSLLSTEVSGLYEPLPRPCIDILWMNRCYVDQIQAVLAKNAKQKPEDALPALDIDEASKSVARRFSIDPSQVEITIRSTSAIK